MANLSFTEKLRRAISHSCITEEEMQLMASEAETYRFKGKLLTYLKTHPTATFREISQYGRMNWLPIIVICDSQADIDAALSGGMRIMDKLSHFVSDPDSEYKVWDEIVYPVMQQRIHTQMEAFIDNNPHATYNQLKAYRNKLSTAFNQQVIPQSVD